MEFGGFQRPVESIRIIEAVHPQGEGSRHPDFTGRQAFFGNEEVVPAPMEVPPSAIDEIAVTTPLEGAEE